MIGILAHGDNHASLCARPLPDPKRRQLALARYWSIIQIGPDDAGCFAAMEH